MWSVSCPEIVIDDTNNDQSRPPLKFKSVEQFGLRCFWKTMKAVQQIYNECKNLHVRFVVHSVDRQYKAFERSRSSDQQ